MLSTNILLGLIFLTQSYSHAQHQLIVLKRDQVIARFLPGDQIRYKLYHERRFQREYVIALTDTTIITRKDTVRIYSISKIDIGERPEKNFKVRSSAYKLIAIGLIMPMAEYITITAVQDSPYEPNPAVTIVSAGLIGAGVVMTILSKPVIRINRKHHLRVISYGSLFYR